MLNRVLRKIQTIVLGYETGKITFSQAGEDLVIRNYFYTALLNKKPGFFVDVGAYHPYKLSNTFYLYLCGWNGINIDPRPGSMKAFNKIRPNDINLEIAISDNKKKMNYYFINENSSMNSFSLDYIESMGLKKNISKVFEIEPLTLKEVFDKHVTDTSIIDFLNIDVEGLDNEVLNSNDWDLYRPRLIAIEIEAENNNQIIESKTAKHLFKNGYEYFTRVPLSAKNVSTVFFVDTKTHIL